MARISQLRDVSNFPEGTRVEVSRDGKDWETIASGEDQSYLPAFEFLGIEGRYIRISLTKDSRDHLWRMRELEVYGSYL